MSFSICFSRTVQKGSLLIDSSTINPEVAKEVASRAQEKGATYLDAPVSGGTDVIDHECILTLLDCIFLLDMQTVLFKQGITK